MASKTQDERGAAGYGGQVSVLASDLVVTGVVASEGTVELHGNVDGEIAASVLTIGNEGHMKGKVQAGQVDLRGELEGAVICSTLTLRAAARLHADVQAASLVIETGADVEGRFSRPAPATNSSRPAAPIAPPAPAPEPEPAPYDDNAQPSL